MLRNALLCLLVIVSGVAVADDTSATDKLRILYSTRFTFTDDGLPLVTVEIMGGKRDVKLHARGGVVVRPDGAGGSAIEADGDGWTITVENARPAQIQEWTVVETLGPDDQAGINAALARWKDRGFDPRAFEIGTIFGTGGEVIDLYTHMVYLADPPNYEPDLSTDSLASSAIAEGRTPEDIAYDLMITDEGKGKFYAPLLNYGHGNLDAVREMLAHPHTVPGLSDGGAHVGTICDGSFPTTLLQYWTRDRAHDRLELPFVIARQARELGMTMPILGGDGWVGEPLKNGREALKNTYISNHYSGDNPDPVVQTFAGNSIGSRHNDELRIGFSGDGGLNALHHFCGGNELFVWTMSTTFCLNLIFDVNSRRARSNHFANGFSRIAPTGIGIDEQWQFRDWRDSPHIFQNILKRCDAEVRKTK